MSRRTPVTPAKMGETVPSTTTSVAWALPVESSRPSRLGTEKLSPARITRLSSCWLVRGSRTWVQASPLKRRVMRVASAEGGEAAGAGAAATGGVGTCTGTGVGTGSGGRLGAAWPWTGGARSASPSRAAGSSRAGSWGTASTTRSPPPEKLYQAT